MVRDARQSPLLAGSARYDETGGNRMLRYVRVARFVVRLFVVQLLLAGGLYEATSVCCAQSERVLSIGSRRELFVDRYFVESLEGARFQLHHPRPAELAVERDQPWEQRMYNGISVIKDGGRFLLYYSALNRLAVAVSSDGIHWRKPGLGLVEWEGSRDNSLVGTADGQLMIGADKPLPEIFLDRRPGIDPDRRFKAFTLIEASGVTKVIGWVSADGFAFQKIREEPLIETSLYGAFDGFESLFWSAVEQRYVLYLRYAIRVSPPNPKDPNRRSVARMTSPDLLVWQEPQRMTFGEAGLLPPDHHYNNQTMPYFRAPHIYVALSSRLAQQRAALTRAQAVAAGLQPARVDVADPLKWLIADCADTVMMTTRGGTHYDRLFQEAVVRPGPGANNWVSRSNYTLRGLHPTSSTEMSIYVNRHNGQHSSHVRRYVFRTDGLVSIHAPFTGGSLQTPPFTFSGKRLQINYATSAVGSLRVEVQTPAGRPVEGLALADCGEIFGDEISRTVRWNSSARLAALAGQPIRLRFVMRDADLYSLKFSDEQR